MGVNIIDGAVARAAIRERGLTQRQFAVRCRIAEETLSRALHGRDVSAEVVRRIVQELIDLAPISDVELVG